MTLDIVITAGGMSSLILEGIKWIVRKIMKNSVYDFPKTFYMVAIPVLNVMVTPLLAIIGFVGYDLPTDWLAWTRLVVQVLISSLVSTFVYNSAIKPLRDYRAQ